MPAGVAADDLEETVKRRLDADLHARAIEPGRDAAGFIATVLARAYPCSTGH